LSGSVKGGTFISRLDFVRHRGGEDLVRRVLERLSEDDRGMLSRTLLPASWYPFDLAQRLDRAIADELRDPDVFEKLGAQSAEDNLGAAHRIYVRKNDPHGLLKHAASIFRLYYDTGYRTYERAGDGKAILRTFDTESFSAEDCLTVIGWHRRAIELCGGRNVRVTHHECRARGASMCQYVCEWS